MSDERRRSPDTVNIRPGVTVLSVLAHLEYKSWFALAEFVDNSIQSFRDCRGTIGPTGQKQLTVDIELESGARSMTIRDDAGGIALKDFPRAFKPAEIPPDKSGLAEFGMGMKSAACWFSPKWTVRTTALGEPLEREVSFDIAEIVSDQLEELTVTEREVPSEAHYTVIELLDLRSVPVGRTTSKIKEHLTDIYREFLRSGELVLLYRGEGLVYEDPEVLIAPIYDTDCEPQGEPIEWRKSIAFDFGGGLRVAGFAALRRTGSTKYAGFSLFRRGRVIEGSGDEKYRPSEIFGAPNSFVAQRLFGELHLTGFEVSHTKDGFRWDENEDPFLELLRGHIDSDELPLLRQARNYREKVASAAEAKVADQVVESTAETIREYGPSVVSEIAAQPADSQPPPAELTPEIPLATRTFEIERNGVRWTVNLELSNEESLRDWVDVSERGSSHEHELSVRVGMASPFMRRLVRRDRTSELEPVVRIAAGLALAEHLARLSGVALAGNVRRNLNRLLADSLSRSTSEPLE